MTAKEIRQQFFDFFESKTHKIVPSAPIVVKNDPTLMFNNAGMNQFKDLFLGNKEVVHPRIADTQKCLRVSGKHNDLEEVGIDSYHHTMFEMLGNWSFGDYFKKEAIAWAWELLTEVYKLDKDRLYVTVFEGDEKDGLEKDQESVELWKEWIPEDRILFFDKKDNFWEMGATGPCGPCTEIHIDLRSNDERILNDGGRLVNMDHPQVIEIWNLVFIQFNRMADSSLESLPNKHVDTGMGFERLAMAIQGKTSNYDTDVFVPFIKTIEEKTGVTYTSNYSMDAKSDIAMRVVADHLRAVCFTIADGEMPSNTGAGYVIRRILRRAVRYYYSFLNRKTPLLHELVDLLANSFKEVFPELEAQKEFVSKVVLEEEKSFLRTLEAGLKRLDQVEVNNGVMDGRTAFELYDTYGFPIDLTRLISSEKNWIIDEKGFEEALNEQKNRARTDAARAEGDWQIVEDIKDVEFVGYDHHSLNGVQIVKYRTVTEKDKEIRHLVLNKTPFYAEGGGQVGDTGSLNFSGEEIKVLDTKKENDLIIHYVNKFPSSLSGNANASIDSHRRHLIENNHSATHLLHAALREVLGSHVQQKGSLVRDTELRFDFSHFQKMTDEQILKVENIVNQRIRENIPLIEDRSISLEEAKSKGAMMLFGEKYGETVRMITFDSNYSVELCGGCHVNHTGELGLFKIKTETGIAAGVRRIEALTAEGAQTFVNAELDALKEIRSLFKNPSTAHKNILDLQEENKALKKEMEKLVALKANALKSDLITGKKELNGINVISQVIDLKDSKAAKTLAYNIEKEIGNAVILFGLNINDKPQLMLTISESLIQNNSLHAGNMVRELAKHIQGGGGGQAFFASAGGQNAKGLNDAIKELDNLLKS